MELCSARGFSSSALPPLLPANTIPRQSPLSRNPHLPFLLNSKTRAGRQQYYRTWCLKATTSEDTSSDKTPIYAENEPPFHFKPLDKKAEEEEYDNQPSGEEGGSFADNLQLSKFFDDVDVKLDFEDTSSVLLFGGGAAVALWLATAVVGAVDSIPVLPKLLELVGLGYTIWFSSRYLIFKKNRDELVAKVEQIKQQVLGSKSE